MKLRWLNHEIHLQYVYVTNFAIFIFDCDKKTDGV